jgi:hypothetical protein
VSNKDLEADARGPEECQAGPERLLDASAVKSEPTQARAARAKLIEDTTYRMTDLFTIIVGRIEILIEKVPAVYREELATIRKVVFDGVKLNHQLLVVSRACRREIGR